MFKLAFRMFCSDIRTVFQGWGMVIVFFMFLFIWVVCPFMMDYGNVLYMAYVWLTSMSWMAPRFTKVCHLVPLTIGQIKKLALYRLLIYLLVVMGGGAVILVICVLGHWNWNPHFGMWYFLYAEVYFVFVRSRIVGFHKNKETNVRLTIFFIAIIFASTMFLMGVFDFLPLYVEYLIQMGLFLLYVPYIVYVFKGMEFQDYQQVSNGLGWRPEFME